MAQTPVGDRVAVLRGWLAELRSQRQLLVETTIAEVGAPWKVAVEAHVDTGSAVLAGYRTAAGGVAWEERLANSRIFREPIGVVGCITPWNYPLYQVLATVGGALMAGCSVVLKPAELTPLSSSCWPMPRSLSACRPAC